jgi:hypothetical protein
MNRFSRKAFIFTTIRIAGGCGGYFRSVPSQVTGHKSPLFMGFPPLCRSQKSQLLCNQANPASFCKIPGVWGARYENHKPTASRSRNTMSSGVKLLPPAGPARREVVAAVGKVARDGARPLRKATPRQDGAHKGTPLRGVHGERRPRGKPDTCGRGREAI